MNTPPPLWEHQERALDWIDEHDYSMLYMGMGTGKTRICIEAIQRNEDENVLVICPKSVIPVWPEQIKRHAHSPKDWLVIAPEKTTVSERANLIRRAKTLDKRPMVVVINYEAVLGPRMKKELEGIEWDTLILDESHRIKAPGGKQSRYIARLAKRIPRRIALTGTPLPQGPLDAYGQFRALDPTLFGYNFTRFRARYAQMQQVRGQSGFFPKVVGYQNLDEFEDLFFSRAIHVSRDELDLPDAQEADIPFDLEGEEARVYKELENEFCALIESGEVTIANALVKIIRLAQVTSGFVKDDDGNLTSLGTSRMSAFADTLTDTTGERVVVFANFRRELEDIRTVTENLKREAYEFSGRRKQLDEWRDSHDGVLVCQVKAASLGIDFTAAAIAIYYAPTWSLADYEQSQARIHRPGQTQNVSFIRMKGRGTVDVDAYAALSKKADVVRAILERRGAEISKRRRVDDSALDAVMKKIEGFYTGEKNVG